MIKKILAITALSVGFSLSTNVSAMDLGQAFGSLTGTNTMTSTQAAMVYKSAARTSVDIGGVEMRVPRSSVNLFSITPPSLSVGCSGISAHFGGFSYISGQQIQQFISHIEQGIPGAVLQLAIKLLCPQCEAVLQAMEKLAQDAAKMAMDSCHVSTAIANNVLGATGNFIDPAAGNSAQNFCAQQQAGTNSQSDSLEGELSSACSTANSALGTLAGWMNNLGSGGPGSNPVGGGNNSAQLKASLSKEGLIGNVTWNALGVMGWCPKDPNNASGSGPANCDTGALHTKLMLMNLLGTTINNAVTASNSTSSSTTSGSGTTTSSSNTIPQNTNQQVYPPTNTVKNLYDMFMCGTVSTAGQGVTTAITHSMADVCNKFWVAEGASGSSSSPWSFYDCDNNDYQQCLVLKRVAFNDPNSTAVTGTGFVFQVTSLLQYGVSQVASGKPFDWNDPKAQQLAALLATAPYPLYQAINAAAVYPAAAADLIDSMGLTTAELMTYTVIEDMLSVVGRTPGAEQSINPKTMKNIYDALEQVRTENVATAKTIADQVSLQEAISREIVQINQTIQRQVMSGDFLGNDRFATALVPAPATQGSN